LPRGLILEGPACGRVLEVLARRPEFPVLLAGGPIIGSDETCATLPPRSSGEAPDLPRALALCAPLRRIVQGLARVRERVPAAGFVLDRFHLSWYAALPNWRLYEAMDEGLARLGGRLVVVGRDPRIDEALARTRLPTRVLDAADCPDALAASAAEFWSASAPPR